MSTLYNLNKENIECYTPTYAVDLVLPYISKDKIIWAPFSMDEHNFAGYLRSLGYTVINTHYNPETNEGQDFLTYEPDFNFDVIIDNPPFKNKTKFVKKAFEHEKPFMLFLPVNLISDNGIPNIYIDKNCDIQFLIPDKRVNFLNQEKKQIPFKTVFLCKDILPKQIIFTKLNK